MDDLENALGDRFKRAPAPSLSDRHLSPAEARADAERRLHQAWQSETARQTERVAEVAPVAPVAHIAPFAPPPTLDPRTEILGQSWEESSNEPRWVAPRDSGWTIAQSPGGNAPQAAQEWVRPSESTAAPAQGYDAPPVPQYVTPGTRYVAPQYGSQYASQATPRYAPEYAPQESPQPAPQYAPQYASQATQQATPQYAPQASQPFTPVAPQRAPQATPQHAPQATPQHAPQATPQYASQATPQYASQVAPQYASQASQQHAPQASQPFTPVAPQRAPSFPPSDDGALRGGAMENLEFARQRVEELRKLQEWRLGQERRVSEEIGRRNALAEAALEEDLQARREAEEHRLERWKAEARVQFERDLAREEAEFERRLADRRRDAEVELEARLLRRIDDAARRAEELEKGRLVASGIEQPADPQLYVVRNAV